MSSHVLPNFRLQPIVQARDAQAIGYELCAGRTSVPTFDEQQWEAWYARLPHELEALEGQFASLIATPVFINLDSWQLLRPSIVQSVQACASKRIVVMEWTERAQSLEQLEQAMAVVRDWQRTGWTAVDDVGEGYDGLGRCLQVRPSFAKVACKVLHAARQEGSLFLRHVVGAMQELGARVIVEGVENGRDEALVRQSGAEYAQGFRYGKDLLTGS
jgi:EAL domain-containing protein (putative c-di-GMP-specific phosphodiesterase class I)